jgi:hypothetical protein
VLDFGTVAFTGASITPTLRCQLPLVAGKVVGPVTAKVVLDNPSTGPTIATIKATASSAMATATATGPASPTGTHRVYLVLTDANGGTSVPTTLVNYLKMS